MFSSVDSFLLFSNFLIKSSGAGHVVRAPEERSIHKALYGRAAGRRPQGRPRMRWVDNVRQDANSLGVRDQHAAALDRRQWKDLVEAVVGLQVL